MTKTRMALSLSTALTFAGFTVMGACGPISSSVDKNRSNAASSAGSNGGTAVGTSTTTKIYTAQDLSVSVKSGKPDSTTHDKNKLKSAAMKQLKSGKEVAVYQNPTEVSLFADLDDLSPSDRESVLLVAKAAFMVTHQEGSNVWIISFDPSADPVNLSEFLDKLHTVTFGENPDQN